MGETKQSNSHKNVSILFAETNACSEVVKQVVVLTHYMKQKQERYHLSLVSFMWTPFFWILATQSYNRKIQSLVTGCMGVRFILSSSLPLTSSIPSSRQEYWSRGWQNYCTHITKWFCTHITKSSSGLPSSGKMRSYWRESSGGLKGWWGDWSISPTRRGWGNWACSAWRREGWDETS